ncbi:MAG: PHP domain-containing protein [Clostridiaceae bacterium]
MLVDMHLHESTHSKDSFITLDQIVRRAKYRGLDAVCITDHDSMGLKEQAEEYSRKTGFPIFVGVEYYSLKGDITAWGIDTFPKERIDPQKFIDFVHFSGGFTVSCHPFRNNNRGLEHNLLNIKNLNGIEVLNGSTTLTANRQALAYCRELGLKPIGASDSHRMHQIGKYVTWLPEMVNNLKDFVSQLRERPTLPAVWNGIHYDVIEVF